MPTERIKEKFDIQLPRFNRMVENRISLLPRRRGYGVHPLVLNEDKKNASHLERSADQKRKGTHTSVHQWKKIGDFNLTGEMAWKRSVTYKSCRKGATLKQIYLKQDWVGDIYFGLELKDSKYQKIRNILIKKSYRSDFQIPCLSICMQNLQFMQDFLEALASIKNFSKINLISQELLATVQPHLHNKQAPPGWIKAGKLLHEGGNDFLRYWSRQSAPIIKEITLNYAMAVGKYYISLETAKNYYKSLMKKLRDEKQAKPSSTDKLMHKYDLEIENPQKLEIFLGILAQFDRSITERLREDILREFSPRIYSSCKMSFLMGLHDRAGQRTAISSMKKNEIFEPKLLGMILSYY